MILNSDKRLGWGGEKWHAWVRGENSQGNPKILYCFFL